MLHSLQVFLSITILYFSFSHLCTFIGVCNNNNNNNKKVRYSSISNNNNNSRDSKVWRVLSYEFRVVRLYRTFSNWCLCTSSGWFKHTEPPLATSFMSSGGSTVPNLL